MQHFCVFEGVAQSGTHLDWLMERLLLCSQNILFVWLLRCVCVALCFVFVHLILFLFSVFVCYLFVFVLLLALFLAHNNNNNVIIMCG